ncbi:MAG: universal stress protein UspA [Bacillales bacterium]|jgi:nucleotide-binding universal stress UspA family protein|nr:universal stress protein UspA [Bacillales bacterium]
MTMDYKKILVAVDGSLSAERAFRKSIDVTKRNNGELIITHVMDIGAYSTVENYDKTLTTRIHDYADKLLSDYKLEAEKAGVRKVSIELDYGSPKVKIARDIADKYNIDLIICGATGLNAVERFIIGSVSEHITRYAKCDVLVVRTEV